jgi:DNA-binding MarR family transcriptional regulator
MLPQDDPDEEAKPAEEGHADLTPAALLTANLLRRSVAALSRRLRARRADHGVSAAKLSILGRLARAAAPLTASTLAERERLQPQSLTRLIAELEQAGLIARRVDASDRRQLLIELTAAGRELIVTDARRQSLWLAAAMSRALTPAEMSVLRVAAELLDQLADARDA